MQLVLCNWVNLQLQVWHATENQLHKTIAKWQISSSESCFVFVHRSIYIVFDFVHLIVFLSFGKATNSQIALASNAAISSSMALSHLGFLTAYSKQVGLTSSITLTMYV
jgi:hypothetical protein